jgi:VIT1/CCC1 family predicted Fe2+/Mn2+ transporter
MATQSTPQQWLSFFLDEQNSALLYHTLAKVEKDERISSVYLRIADTEIRHAEVWSKKLVDAGKPVPEFKPTWQTKMLIWLSHRFGPNMILPTIQNMEQQGSLGYAGVLDATGMQGEEQSHDFLVSQIKTTVKGGLEGGVLAQLEGRHRSAGGNALRAAVLGANDGLVSNLSLVMGVAGAAVGNRTILITGLAGMLAGAISMALGEWLSVQSSRELYSHQIAVETAEIESAPEEEAEELALIYEARGLKPEHARSLANQILENKASAVQTLVREELGIDPDELGGSAWEAAITSFFLFMLGAIIPVAPFIFLTGSTAVLVSIGLSVIGLFLLGAVITLFTGKTVLYSGFRMVIFGLLAAAVTFGIGHLIGASIAG